VSVLTVDFSGFGEMVEAFDPGVIVSELNDIYTAFDRIGEQFGCERIKTIGDVYVTVAGVPDPLRGSRRGGRQRGRALPALPRACATRATPTPGAAGSGWPSGSVIGSVVGVQKYIYDVFGPAVTRAQRLRLLAEPMTVCVDAGTAAAIGGRFDLNGQGVRDLGDGTRVEVWSMAEPVSADVTGRS
jgi:adenylate cyclase